jgi:uncharacterized protein (TIGR02284 family)
MENTKTIEVLNALVEINNDRIEGYKTALNETSESDLKELFSEFEAVSRKFSADLATEIVKFNGEVIDGTTTSGKFYRVWMDLKSAATGQDRKAILNSCEYGENVAQEKYIDVLENHKMELSPELEKLIFEQKTLLKNNLYTIKGLLEVL